MRDVFVRGMWGLGDNIYQRAVIRELCRSANVWLETPWPQIYSDLDVRFVRGERLLRAQTRNIAAQPPATWSIPPRGAAQYHLVYGSGELRRGTMVDAMRRALGVGRARLTFDLPPLSKSHGRRPIAIVRPATVRREWTNEARNPCPDYINVAAAWLRSNGYLVYVVADLVAGEEWIDGGFPLPDCDYNFSKGELSVTEMLALARDAAVIVGGVGWIVPAGIALQVPTFVVMGGHGAHNAPEKLIDGDMDLQNIVFAMPERFCQCSDKAHRCEKTIVDLLPKLQHFLCSRGLPKVA